MNSFLEQWAEGEAQSPRRVRNGEEPPTTDAQRGPKMADSRESSSKSPEEWKAAELNKLFAEQGLTGKPGRLTAETVRHGNNPGTRNELRAMGCEPEGDPNATQARGEIGGLLAIAYKRYAKGQRSAEDRCKDLADGKLALPGEPSVHGVVS